MINDGQGVRVLPTAPVRNHGVARGWLGALMGLLVMASALAEEQGPAPNIRFQFNGIPYADAVQSFAQMTGKAVIGEVHVDGVLTFADPNPYTYEDALDTFNLILAMKGIVLVETDRYLRVAPKEDLPELPLKIFRGLEGAEEVRPGEVVTVVLPLAHSDANEISAAAQPMLTGAGTVTPLAKGRGIVVTDRFDAIQRIKKLVVEVDVEVAGARELRTVRLVSASGGVLAQIIERTFGAATAPKQSRFDKGAWRVAPPNPEDYVTVNYDEPSRTLVLFGPPALLNLASELVSNYEKDSGSVGKITVFYPRTLEVSELATMIRNSIPGVAAAGESASSRSNKAHVIADSSRKRLIVMTPATEQLEAIRAFILKIDGGTADSGAGPVAEEIRLTRVLRVEHGDVPLIARMIRDVARTPGPGGLQVHEDTSSGSIVVVGQPDVVQLAEQIYAQLDVRPPDSEPRETRLFALSGDDVENARRLSELVSQIYEERYRDADKNNTPDGNFLVDVGGRRLIVTARQSHLPVIAEILETVRAPTPSTPAPRELRVVTLDHADVADVVPTLNQILEEREREGAWRDVPRPLVLSDDARNRLLVTATADQLEEIREIVSQLDAVEPVKKRIVRVVQTRTPPGELVSLVQNLFEIESGEERPELIADHETSRLHVLATAKQHARLAVLIEQLDAGKRKGPAPRVTRAFDVESGDASQVVRLVRQIYEDQISGQDVPQGVRATLLASDDGDRILVTGPEDQIVLVEELIERLATPARPEVTRLTRALDIQGDSASDIVSVVQELYVSQLEGREDPLGGRATLIASSDDRRILITGPAEQIEVVTAIVAQIDTPIDDVSEETRIVRLRVADVDELSSLLERALNRGGRQRDSVRIQTDARSRSLVLSGKTESLDEAAKIIAELDVAPELQPRELRVIDLRGGDAERIAQLTSDLFEQELRDRHGPGYRMQARVIGDSDSSRIVLAAPRSEMERLAEIVQSLQTNRTGKSESRAFDLKHAKAENVARVLRQSMTATDGSGRSVERVQVAYDESTNTVVVTGETRDIEQLAGVVKQLDVSKEQPQPTETRFFQFANVQELEQIAPLVQRLYERELESVPDDKADAQFLQDRTTARLIVTARPEHFGRVEEILVRLQLDRDDPTGPETKFVQYADVEELQRIHDLARKVYQEQRSGDQSGREAATILLDRPSRRLIVTGAKEEIARVEAILEQIGTAERAPVETRFFPFDNVDELDRVYKLARKIYAEQRSGDVGAGDPAAILVDSESRQLIVTGATAEIARVAAILEQIGTMEREPTDTRILRLQSAASNEIIGLVRSAARSLTGDVELTIDQDQPSNSLILSGPVSAVESAAAVVKELDRPVTTLGSELRVIELDGATAADVGPKVQRVFEQLMTDRHGPRYESKVRIVPDETSNRLLVTAPSDQLPEILEIVDQLDRVSVQTAGTRIFKLEFGDAEKLGSVLSAALVTRDSRGREIRSATVSADANTNTIVVSGTREDIQAAALIINQLDADEASPERELRLVNVASGEASSLASLARNVWTEKHRGLSEEDEVQFTPTGDGMRIAVIGPKTHLDEATKILADLDVSAPDAVSQIRIIELENAAATAIASTVEESFHRLMRSRVGRRYEAMARVVGDDVSNRLVITAPSDQVEEILAIVDALDQESTQSDGTRIFKLEFSDAEKIAAILSSALVTKNARGREINRANVSWDANTNNVVVTGTREYLQAANTIVSQLDQDSVDEARGVRMVELRVELEGEAGKQLAELAGRVWSEKYGGAGSASHVEFTVSPDARRMVVVGPESQLDVAQELVTQLQQPALASSRRLFTIALENRAPEDLEPLIRKVIEERLGQDARVSVSADPVARRMVVVSSPDDMEAIREIIAELDQSQEVGVRETRVYDLKASFAPDLARNVSDLFREESKDRADMRPENVLVLGDGATNRVIVRAPGNEMALIDQIIHRLDEVTLQTSDTRVFRPKVADVDRLAKILNQTLTKIERGRPVPRVSVGADRNSKTLVVSGEPKDLRSATIIIESLDKEQTLRSRILKSFPIREGLVGGVGTIKALYEGQVRTSLDTAPPDATIVDDAPTGRLIVTASEAHMQIIEQIITEINSGETAYGRARQFIKFESPLGEVMAEILAAMYRPDVDTRDPVKKLNLAPAPDGYGLIVDGPKELVEDVEVLVRQVEQENRTSLVEIRTYGLENAKATELAETLARLFAAPDDEKNKKPNGGAPTPRFEAHEASNQLLIAASTDQFAEIERTLESLKVSTELASQTRTFVIKGGDAESVADVLQAILIDESDDGPVVKVSAASGMGAIVVQGPPEKIELAERLIEGFEEVVTSGETVVQTVKLEKGVASSIASAVNNALSDRQWPAERVRVTAEPNSNTVLLEGPKEAIPEVRDIIKALDEESTGGVGETEVRSFKIQSGEASALLDPVQTLVNAMISQRVSRGGDIPTPPFTITADSRSNSLVVYSQPPYFDVVEKLLVELDRAPDHADQTVEFVPLRHISAYVVRRQLNAVYADRATRDRPVIEADPFGNSLTILGRPSDIEFIEQLVAKIDRTKQDDEVLVRVLPLGQIPASEIADLLVNIYAQIAGEKIEIRTKLPRRRQIYDKGFRLRGDQEDDEDSDDSDSSGAGGDSSSSGAESSSSSGDDDDSRSSGVLEGKRHGEIAWHRSLTTLLVVSMLSQEGESEEEPEEDADDSVEPTDAEAVGDEKVMLTIDPESNSLLLSGPRSDLDRIEDLISKLTFNFETGDFEFRIFKLREASPAAVSTLLDNLFNIKVPVSVDSKGNQTLPPPKITVVVDNRSRSVIVRALPSDFVLIEKIVRDLDSGGVGSEIEFRNFSLSFALPRNAAGLVRNMVQGLEQVRPGERIVVLPDPRTRSLLVAARPELYIHIQEIIARVDAATTDADNEVAFVQLLKANAVNLAEVLRSMLRPESGGGVSEEARALQEQVRLLRVRNDAGIPVVLDLTRPIKILSDTRGGQGGNRLIITSTRDNVRALEAIARLMDTVPVVEGVTVSFQRLERADATVAAQTLREIFTSAQTFRRPDGVVGEPAGETGQALVRPVNVAVDVRTNTVIVSGPPSSVTLALAVVADLDQESESVVTEVRLFRLRHASAVTLLPVLRSVFTESTSVPGAVGLNTQVTRLRALMPETEPKTTELPRGRQALTIQAEATTNTVIVAARSDTMPLIADVIKTMDIPAAAALNSVRIYPLEHANAATIQKVINDLQSGARTLRAEDRAVVSVDSRTNALVVAGNERSFSFITALVFQLDRAGDPAVGLAVIPLQFNNASEVATVIRQLFLARQRGRVSDGVPPSSQDRVDIFPDRLTNSLVISAGKENLELVRGIVESVDVAPVADGGVLRIFPLTHADARGVATMLNSLVRQGLYRPGMMMQTTASRATERVAIGIDGRTNAIIVSASPKNMAVIEQLLNELDNPSAAQLHGMRVFQVQHASVGQLAPTLREFFEARRAAELAVGDPERRIPVVIIPDLRTNTLLVAGSRRSFDSIEQLLRELDTDAIRAENIYRVFPLTHASAVKLQSTLEQLFDNRPRRLGQPPPQPITVVADRWVNALLVSALPEDLEIVASLVERLDSGDSPGDKVRVIPVVHANASSVAQTITSLFATGTGEGVSAVQVGVDERINALVISAGDGDYDRIVELVKELDSELVARVSEIRVFPLRHASATELAGILTQAVATKPESLGGESEERQTLLQYITRSADGRELVSSALQEGVLVTPDTRTNSLVVSAPVANLPLIEQLIYKLDTSSPQLAKIKVFSLINADATEMARILTELFRLKIVETGGAADEDDASDVEGRAVRYVLTREGDSDEGGAVSDDGVATVGTAEQDSLVVTVDGRTNSLILGGTDHYVSLAGAIIEKLDSSPALERRTEVYRLRNARAADISDALTAFFHQSQAGSFTTVGDQELGASVQQQLEQEVSLVGEPTSNTLLVTASPRYFDEVARIIEELDQPQPQVLIQALIAEVTLEDSLSLGVEFDYVGEIDDRPIDVATDFGVVDEIASLGGLSAVLTAGDLNSVLRALQSDGRLEVLSRPQILAVDNQEAVITIGQQVPQITGSQTTELGNVVNTLEYRDVGVILRVIPRISPDGFVRLEVEPQISSLSSSSVSVGQSGSAPIFNERKAQTTVSVRDGHTIMIGGLISTDDDIRDDGVPILKSIPGLGLLFRDRSVTKRRTELIIVLTPQIITTVEEADAMTRMNIEQSTIQGQEGRDETQTRLLQGLQESVGIVNGVGTDDGDAEAQDIDVDGTFEQDEVDE